MTSGVGGGGWVSGRGGLEFWNLFWKFPGDFPE